MDTGAYMANQMDNLIEASQHLYNEFCNDLDKEMSEYIKENGYDWTIEDILKEYREKYSKGIYVSHTCRIIIKHFEEKLKLI